MLDRLRGPSWIPRYRGIDQPSADSFHPLIRQSTTHRSASEPRFVTATRDFRELSTHAGGIDKLFTAAHENESVCKFTGSWAGFSRPLDSGSCVCRATVWATCAPP